MNIKVIHVTNAASQPVVIDIKATALAYSQLFESEGLNVKALLPPMGMIGEVLYSISDARQRGLALNRIIWNPSTNSKVQVFGPFLIVGACPKEGDVSLPNNRQLFWLNQLRTN